MGIGLQPLILKENKSSQKILVLSVGNYSISLSLKDYISGNSEKFVKKNFNKPLPIKDINDELRKILDNNIDNIEINNIVLFQENDFYVLVPNELYSDNEKKAYLKYTTQTIEDDFIAVDNLDSLQIKNVYIPFVNINNLLVELFNNIDYFHFNTELINKIYNNRDKQEFFVYVDNSKIKILVFDKEALRFFNSYEVENSTDIIYFILLVMKENNLQPEKEVVNYIIDYIYDDLEDISKNFLDNYKIFNENFEVDYLHS